MFSQKDILYSLQTLPNPHATTAQPEYRPFDHQFNELTNKLQNFFLSQYGIRNKIVKEFANSLLRQIERTCAAVADQQSKLYLMNQIINDFIVNKIDSFSSSVYLKSILLDSIRDCWTEFDNLQIQHQRDYLVRAEMGIPEKGKKANWGSAMVDSVLGRTIENHLYSHWKLTGNQGMPANMQGELLPDGWYQFVILNNNEVRFLPTGEGNGGYLPYQKYRAHTQLADGKPVYSAGSFLVSQNRISLIDGASGHYGTEKLKYVQYAKHVFSQLGIDMSQAQIVSNESSHGAHKWFRTKKTASILFKSLISRKNADERPEPQGYLASTLPRI